MPEGISDSRSRHREQLVVPLAVAITTLWSCFLAGAIAVGVFAFPPSAAIAGAGIATLYAAWISRVSYRLNRRVRDSLVAEPTAGDAAHAASRLLRSGILLWVAGFLLGGVAGLGLALWSSTRAIAVLLMAFGITAVVVLRSVFGRTRGFSIRP